MGNSAAKSQPEAHGTDKGAAGVCSNMTVAYLCSFVLRCRRRGRGGWMGNPKDRMKMLGKMNGTSRTWPKPCWSYDSAFMDTEGNGEISS